jgi:hypothetical protein
MGKIVKMEKIFILAFTITILFSVLKFLEMKYLDKDIKALKFFVRDAFIVFVSSFAAAFVLLQYDHLINDFFAVVTDSKVLTPESTQVFTGEPGF